MGTQCGVELDQHQSKGDAQVAYMQPDEGVNMSIYKKDFRIEYVILHLQ